jgi:transmembrane sensor
MKLTNKTYQTLISDYLTGNCSDRQREQLESWIEQSDENKKTFEAYRKIWSVEPAEKPLSINTEAAWKNVEASLWQTDQAETSKAPRTLRSWNMIPYISGIAATLLLLAGIYLLLQNTHSPKLIHYYANENTTEPMILPDNSKVFLNNGTHIAFPEKFAGKSRKITLDGEAFFVVAHDATKPFIIDIGETEVKVLGTSFNVADRINTKTVEVAVVTGKVVFYPAADPDHMVILSQGELGIFDKTDKSIRKKTLKNNNFMAWKTGVLEFQQTPLTIVLATLEKTYNINIEAHTSISDLKLTARFSQDTPEDIFKTLSLVFGFEVVQSNNNFVIRQGAEE